MQTSLHDLSPLAAAAGHLLAPGGVLAADWQMQFGLKDRGPKFLAALRDIGGLTLEFGEEGLWQFRDTVIARQQALGLGVAIARRSASIG